MERSKKGGRGREEELKRNAGVGGSHWVDPTATLVGGNGPGSDATMAILVDVYMQYFVLEIVLLKDR